MLRAARAALPTWRAELSLAFKADGFLRERFCYATKRAIEAEAAGSWHPDAEPGEQKANLVKMQQCLLEAANRLSMPRVAADPGTKPVDITVYRRVADAALEDPQFPAVLAELFTDMLGTAHSAKGFRTCPGAFYIWGVQRAFKAVGRPWKRHEEASHG